VIKVLLLFFINTLVGAYLTWLHVKNKDKVLRNKILLKFLIFFLINLVLISFIIFNVELFKFVFVLLLAMGFYEIFKNGLIKPKFLFFAVVIYLLISILALKFILSSSALSVLLIYCFTITFDGFSQATGQLLGKFKLVPKTSPNKTFEGMIGGLIFVLINYWILFPEKLTFKPLLSLILIISACQLGDLLASRYKRLLSIKDFSHLIPAHGGILDRFDSFFMAICVASILKFLSYEI
jgi:phosphatidate cytidylyltransferase